MKSPGQLKESDSGLAPSLGTDGICRGSSLRAAFQYPPPPVTSACRRVEKQRASRGWGRKGEAVRAPPPGDSEGTAWPGELSGVRLGHRQLLQGHAGQC